MQKTDHVRVAVKRMHFDEKFVRPAFDNIRPDWELGLDSIRYRVGTGSISGGRPGELPLFKAAFEWAARRYKSK